MSAKLIATGLALVLSVGCMTTPSKQRQSVETAEAAELNLRLGIAYMQQGHYDLALTKLKKSLSYDSDSAKTHNAIAVLFEETKRPELAKEHYRKAVELDPKFGVARMNYGRLLCAGGEPEQGKEQFLALIDEAEFSARDAAYIGAGICARLASELQRAESYFREALEENPDAAAALYELAELSHLQGDNLQARAFLQRFHDKASYSPQSLRLGIVIEQALGGEDLRREYVELLSSRFADSDQARQLKKSE